MADMPVLFISILSPTPGVSRTYTSSRHRAGPPGSGETGRTQAPKGPRPLFQKRVAGGARARKDPRDAGGRPAPPPRTEPVCPVAAGVR